MDQTTATRFRIPRDVWIGLAALVLAALYWAGTKQISVSPLDGVVNATAMPRALAMAMALFSLLLIARALLLEWMSVRATRAAGASPGSMRAEDGRRFTLPQHFRAVGVLVIGVLYLLLLPRLGYLPSMALLVLAASVYIGARPSVYTLAVAAGVALAFYLIFDRLLGIPLPEGLLSGVIP